MKFGCGGRSRSARAGIKGLTQKQVQLMDRHGEFRKCLRLAILEVARFETPSCLIEAPTQRKLLFKIPQLTQKSANFVDALMRRADPLLRLVRGKRSRQNALEQHALEFTATLRPFGVDPAAIVLA